MELKQLYTDLILEYNKDKTNKRKIENPTVHEHGHNPSCGDDIDIEVKIEDGVIKDLAYTGTGCAISQASTAMMAELLQGRTVEEGIRLCRLFLDMIRGKVTDDESLEELEAAITLKDISKMPVRVKCATLGWHTLEMALTRIENSSPSRNKHTKSRSPKWRRAFFTALRAVTLRRQRSLNHAAGALITGSCDYQEA